MNWKEFRSFAPLALVVCIIGEAMFPWPESIFAGIALACVCYILYDHESRSAALETAGQ